MSHERIQRLGADPVTPHTNGAADRRRLGEELRASELRYRRLFETAKDGILVLDGETGRITDVNPFLVDLLGYSHEELVGRELWEIGPVKDIEASRAAMRHLQDAEYIRYEDLPLETRSKQRVQVEFVSNVYLVDGARVIQCNVRDITARKHGETRLLKLNDDLLALLAEMRLRDREMIRLNQMNDLLQASATQEEACKVIELTAIDLFAGHGGFLALVHPEDRRLETVARWGEGPAASAPFQVGDCWALRRGHPHEVVDPRSGVVCGHLADRPATASLCVPLTVHGDALGLLCVTGSPNDVSRSAVRQQLAVTMGEAVKLSLSNLRLRETLREQAALDSLTGLYNRRFLDECLARELHRAARRKSPICVAMLDLDRFKEFNDTFGHEAGDAVLRELGRVLRDRVRRCDISCRYGGEEFVLVFPDSSLQDTRHRVDQIRAMIGELELRYDDRPLGRITVSVGVAQADPDGSTPGELLRAADEALYAAKQAGRDCVVVHPAVGRVAAVPSSPAA